jgi:hypothetical protein
MTPAMRREALHAVLRRDDKLEVTE